MTKDSYLRYSRHLGSILFNLSIVGLLFVIGFTFMPILWLLLLFLLAVFGLLAIAFSGGIALASETFLQFMSGSFSLLLSEEATGSIETLLNYTPLVATITGILIALSALFLLLDRKSKKSQNRLIALIVFAVIFVVLVIVICVTSLNGGA